jgi:hypothetical protein
MQVIGFNFNKISATKTDNPKGKMNIKMGITFEKLTKEAVKSVNQDVIKADFDFSVDYVKIANLGFKGSVYFTATPDKIKEIIKHWDKNKQLTEELKVPLMNFVLNKCNVKSLQLEEEFNLPPHIKLPKIALPVEDTGKKDTKYV